MSIRKKILVTGAAGFIGSNFIKKIAISDEVKLSFDFVIADTLTYAGHFYTIENEIKNNDNISFIKIDIRDKNKINQLFTDYQFSSVLHYAAESHVDRSIKNACEFIDTNVTGTLNLLNSSLAHCAKSKDFKFVHVSTDEVYGSLKKGDPPFTENNHLLPNSPYSASKASSDLLVRSFYKTHGLWTVTTRCSNNYGPYQLPEKLIPLMIVTAMENKTLPVYGKGENIRDWIYVDDHNQGVWKAFLNGKAGEIYNFGGNSECSNIDVVKKILKILNKNDDLINYVEDRPGHDYRYAMDFSKAQNELNFSPTMSFEEGLERTVNWYKNNMNWVNKTFKKN